jgi:hypothetical protein
MDIMAVSSSATQYAHINCITYSVLDEKFRIVEFCETVKKRDPAVK